MSPARVMIVDDEPDLIRALGLRLKAAGYEVLAAADGIRAMQMAIRDQPAVILLDIGMPGGDGHTIVRRLKASIRTMTIPIIFLTARKSPEDLSKAKEAGVAAYLLKPFKPEELLAAIEKALSEARPAV
ncbi:MAG TPA: response regulator [Candidatus Polarisedimenticolia bacterium]|nr:response regulator [Candidatus Polarisedimenticolia bacterium]